MEIFHHVTRNKINCGLRAKPAKICDECLPCQSIYGEIRLSYFVKLVCMRSGC